jgi:hypothetical protein
MRRTAVVVIPLLILLTGCGAGGDSAGSNTAALSDSADSGAKAAPAAGTQDGTNAQPAVSKSKPVVVPRSLIRTAQLEVRVADVKKAAAAAQQAVEGAGGELAKEELDLQTDNPSATLQLRVPPARLGAMLTQLSRLGDERARQVGTDDVTDQVADLDSRLATQRTSVARVRALLDRATSVADVVRVEAELSRREADLESLQARTRALSGQVSMATITLALTSKATPTVATTVGFRSGLEGGWHAFVAAARVTAATVGALLPFLPLLVASLWGALWWRRRTASGSTPA